MVSYRFVSNHFDSSNSESGTQSGKLASAIRNESCLRQVGVRDGLTIVLLRAKPNLSEREDRNKMASYGKKAGDKVHRAMHEMQEGKLKSGRSGKKVTSRKQAIAIGLSEAREAGGKVPSKKSSSKSSSKKSSSKKSTTKKSSSKKK